MAWVIIEKCCLCGEYAEPKDMHNAAPLKDGKCCEKCNLSKVIPARIKSL